MRARVLSSSVEFSNRPFRLPLQLSTGTITEITEARVEVEVEIDGITAQGKGSIYLSDLWAWPDPNLAHSYQDNVLRSVCREIAKQLIDVCGSEPAHPLELGLHLHDHFCHPNRLSNIPVLALAMCASPFDAAIHDAVGIARGISAFQLYGDASPLPSADRYFGEGGAIAAIRNLLADPIRDLDAWLIVSKGDSLEEDVEPWVRNLKYRCFKLKIGGKDNEEDATRTAEVYRFVKRAGAREPRLCVDSNEGNPDSTSVMEYLRLLKEKDPEAFAALEYLEQPTGRDITIFRYDWQTVASIKPILLDEGLTSLDLLEEAKAQGWSGLALKTCKGHSFALTAAAWAKENGMIYSLQDLTNPGLSLIHAALLAAHIHPINGVELNSPQYTPQANAQWLPRLSPLFEPRDGLHHLPREIPVGLGSLI